MPKWLRDLILIGAVLGFVVMVIGREVILEHLASYHTVRADLLVTQHRPIQALAHFKRAYQYQVKNLRYAYNYAEELQKQKRFDQAEPIYQKTLDLLRWRVQTQPVTYLPALIGTLNGLGSGYWTQGRYRLAITALEEAQDLYWQLSPAQREYQLAIRLTTLRTLGDLYRVKAQWEKAIEVLQEAQTLYWKLSSKERAQHQKEQLGMLTTLGEAYRTQARWGEAAAVLEEAQDLYWKAAQKDRETYLPALADTLDTLTHLALTQDHAQQAQKSATEALSIRWGLWKSDPEAHGDALAQSLALTASVLQRTNATPAEICKHLQEAEYVARSASVKQRMRKTRRALCIENG